MNDLPAIKVESIQKPFDEDAKASLGGALRSYVSTRRWFRAKTKTISEIQIADVIDFPKVPAFLLILQIRYAAADTDRYLLPVSVGSFSEEWSEEPIARLFDDKAEVFVVNALTSERFHQELLHSVICESALAGQDGVLQFSRTSSLTEKCQNAAPELKSFVSRAEQSNTSIIFGDRYILKLFRKLEDGINPDVEIGQVLTERGFKNTPAVLGSVIYRSRGQSSATGILQQFVKNTGDAWAFTLASLETFFRDALAAGRKPPRLPHEHPLDLIGQNVPEDLRSFAGSYLESAALLGQRTAEMHAALTDPQAGPDFVPEQFTSVHARELHRSLVAQANSAFDLLRSKLPALEGQSAEAARELLHLEDEIGKRFAAVEHMPVTAVRIRHHGDYHLGQVLYTGDDFMIIDFEGEPARPLAERRAKALAMRDVAGMVRSFQYAAFAALFGETPQLPSSPEGRGAVEAWAEQWNAYVSAQYLQSYFQHAHGLPFLSSTSGEQRALLDAFLLQKALYELGYELNNRPAWLLIPLRGILSLIR